MDWREVTIYTTTEGIGPVEALLEYNGVEGYVLEDAADFEEFLKDTEIYWDYVDADLVREKRAQETCLKIYLPDSDEGAKQYADIRAALENLKARDEEHAWGRLCTETALTRQEDWEWGWKQYFKPFPVGRGFMIKPSWETVEDPQGRRILEIDPASSFGTGSHDTTQLCMMALEDAVKPGDKLLDMGTGSGILAIAALVTVVVNFGVLQQYRRLDKAQAAYDRVHTQYVSAQEALADYDRVLLEYRTYSMEWATDGSEDNGTLVDRQKALDLLEQEMLSRGRLVSLQVSGNKMVVSMSGMSLDQISRMFDVIQQSPIVSNVELNLASTEDGNVSTILDFTVRITLRSAEEAGK